MNKVNEVIDQLTKQGYEYGTGIWPYMNKNLKIKLNKYGEYETYIIDKSIDFSVEEIKSLYSVNNLLSKEDETSLGKELFANQPDIKFDKNLGYYTDLYIGYVNEGDFREQASSGGMGTWIFTELLDKGYIDSVINVKKSSSSDKLFEYAISKSKEEIIDGAKTKYYPVELSQVLGIVKKEPGKYAIIGLPTFISELRLLAKQDSIINDRILFMIGLVCGHQKSTKFGEVLAWQCGIKPGDLLDINFRKKLDYGPSSSYAIEVTGWVNGKKETIIKEMKDLYGGDWGRGLFKVRASDFSDDVMNETADMTLGDAWLPEYTKDNKGNNIIIVRNSIIRDLVENGIKEKRLHLDRVTPTKIYQSQSSHYSHTQEELGYRLYKKQKSGEWVPKKRFDPSNDIPFLRKRVQDIREKICLKAPDLYEKAVKKDDFNQFRKSMIKYDFLNKLTYKFIRIQRKIKRKN